LALPFVMVYGAESPQRRALADKHAQLGRMLKTIDATITSEKGGCTIDEKEMFEVFGEYDPARYEAEAERRWGASNAYQESARRSKRYTKDDWAAIKAENDALNGTLAALMAADVPASDARAMDLAEEHRLQIDRRFSDTYDRVRPGLAIYLHDAIIANAARHAG